MIKKIIEAGINATCGRLYYKLFHLPKIKKVSKQINMIKPIIHLSFDLDMKEDLDNIPQLLQSLKRYNIKASFAIIGRLIEQYPEVHKQIVKEGHELINHTYSHPEIGFDKLHPIDIEYEILKCHQVAQNILGYHFKGFRIPHFGVQFTRKIYPILKDLGYTYSSSTVACKTILAGFPYFPNKQNTNIMELPLVCCPKHPFCLFDSSHAFRSRFAKHSAEDFLKTFEHLLNQGYKRGMFLNIYLDPQDLPKYNFNRMLELINDFGIEVKSYKDMVGGDEREKENNKKSIC